MEIYQKAFDIIERYFGTEEEDKEVSSFKRSFKLTLSYVQGGSNCNRESVRVWTRW